jgi:tripartite-type tricarboxylate transporter receptor subunit TctC
MNTILRFAIAGVTLASTLAAAQVVKIVVPAPAGGGTDGFFRLVAKEAEPFLNQSPHDYVPVIQLSQSPYVFCVAPAFPAKDGKGFIEELRRNPNKYTFGNDGVGGTGQLAAQRIFRSLKVSVRDVPFKGAGETLNNFLGGHVDIYVGSISTIMPHVKGGKARCLLVSSAARTPTMTEASGLADLGIPGEETLLWRAILAPKGAQPELVAKLETAFEKAMQTPATRKFCEDAGEQIVIRKGADLRRMLDSEYAALGAVAQSLNIAK